MTTRPPASSGEEPSRQKPGHKISVGANDWAGMTSVDEAAQQAAEAMKSSHDFAVDLSDLPSLPLLERQLSGLDEIEGSFLKGARARNTLGLCLWVRHYYCGAPEETQIAIAQKTWKLIGDWGIDLDRQPDAGYWQSVKTIYMTLLPGERNDIACRLEGLPATRTR
jgi:hypothetical protein